MRSVFLATGVAILIGILPAAHSAEFGQLQPNKSQIMFISKQMGVPVDGVFKKFAAQIAFDPAKPDAGRAQIEIDLTSIDTGNQEANEEVVGKNWFNVKSFPTAKFVSTGVKPLGNGRFEVAGKMTIKGKTRDLSAPFTMKQEGNNAQFDGVFTLKRLEYGIGEGPWGDTDTVANEVQVKFRLVTVASGKS